MKKWTSVLAVFVATLMVVGSAMAQGAGSAAGSAAGGSGTGGTGPSGTAAGQSGATPGSPTTSGSDRSKAESPAGTPSGGAAASGSMSATTTASADFTGRHTMEGEVVKVDQKKGHVTLKTAEGNMDLHFPPSALANVKRGDRMSVELAMKPAGSASIKSDMKDTKGSASPKTDDAKKK